MNKKNEGGFSKIVIILVLFVLVVGGFFVFSKFFNKSEVIVNNKEGKGVLIGFSITTNQEERWKNDQREFLKKAQEMGATVQLETAQNDAKKQVSQIEKMIVNGVDVIVIVPYDSKSLTDVIKKAHDAGIKVISYDRLINNADVDLYISFDNEKVGEYEAQSVVDSLKSKMDKGEKVKIAYIGGAETDNNSFLLKKGSFKVLQPLIDSKKVEIVFDKFTLDWNPDKAYANFKEYLSKNNAKIDGVVAANDGTAFGVITALKEYGLDGKIPVSGQDAELAALQRVVAGTQTMTVYKSINKLASSSVLMAISLAKDLPIEKTGTINDGKFLVPTVFLDPIAVTKDNINDTVIKDGYQTKADIYKSF